MLSTLQPPVWSLGCRYPCQSHARMDDIFIPLRFCRRMRPKAVVQSIADPASVIGPWDAGAWRPISWSVVSFPPSLQHSERASRETWPRVVSSVVSSSSWAFSTPDEGEDRPKLVGSIAGLEEYSELKAVWFGAIVEAGNELGRTNMSINGTVKSSARKNLCSSKFASRWTGLSFVLLCRLLSVPATVFCLSAEAELFFKTLISALASSSSRSVSCSRASSDVDSHTHYGAHGGRACISVGSHYVLYRLAVQT